MPDKNIKIIDKKNCCGCNACREVCPKSCIEMRRDNMGCAYPYVDRLNCIRCGLCLRVCPFASPAAPLRSIVAYAAVNKDEKQRMASSSGGVFIALARRIIECGGVVFGAVFTMDGSVKHTCAETMEGVLPMMGSKYVQSDTNNTFYHAKHMLDDGRMVLYTGTPCQIAGLKHYLGKDYSNLLAVEVICHGAPAPGVWNTYLKEIHARPPVVCVEKNSVSVSLKGKPVITGISFRDKRQGWKKYGFVLRFASSRGEANSVSSPLDDDESYYEPFTENQYMTAFLQNWSLRPSCYACKAKGGTSQADITIGDFWGIEKITALEDDDKGTSCVICRTQIGLNTIKNLQELTLHLVDYDEIYRGNPNLEKNVPFTFSARRFQKLFSQVGFFKTMDILEHPLFLYRGFVFFQKLVNSFRKIIYRKMFKKTDYSQKYSKNL